MGYWIGTIILALFACFGIWVALTGSGSLAYVAAAFFALATGLLFPPFWRGGTNRIWRLTRVVLALVLTATAFSVPINMTHAVILVLPKTAPASHKN